MVRVFIWTPDCWQELCMLPEGLATGYHDQSFQCFSSALEQRLSWYPKSTWHRMLLIKPSTKSTTNFSPKRNPPQRHQNLVTKLPSKHKIQPQHSTSFLCCMFLTVQFPARYLLHLATSLTLPARRAVNAWLPQEQQTFQTHPSPSYFLLSFLDLHQSSRYLTSSFTQKFKPLDSLELSRTAKNIVLPYLQLLPTHFAYSHFYCRGLIFIILFYNAELSRTPRSYAILSIISEPYIYTYIFYTFVP